MNSLNPLLVFCIILSLSLASPLTYAQEIQIKKVNDSTSTMQFRKNENSVYVGVGKKENGKKNTIQKKISDRYSNYIQNTSYNFIGVKPQKRIQEKYSERLKQLKKIGIQYKIIADSLNNRNNKIIDFNGGLYPGVLEKHQKRNNDY